jgi:hypothetical protein
MMLDPMIAVLVWVAACATVYVMLVQERRGE